MDGTGRLDRLDILDVGGSRAVDFHWTGGIYQGRDHVYDPALDPLEQFITLDGLGRGVGFTYLNDSEPLFDQQLKRDVLGRARSVQSGWTGDPALRWRGYEYNAEGRLTVVHEHAGAIDPVDPSLLANHSLTNADILGLTVGQRTRRTSTAENPENQYREPGEPVPEVLRSRA